MGDGVLMTRLFAVILILWPIAAVGLVFALRRDTIAPAGIYFLKSLGISYAVSLGGPIVMLAAFFLLGLVAEVATLYTMFLGIPLFAASPLLIAAFFSRRSPGSRSQWLGRVVRRDR